MNKQQASEFLGIGRRSLERYMSQERIAYTRQRGKTGDTVVFNQAELERFKDELHQPTHQAVVDVRQESPSISSGIVSSSLIMATLGEIKSSLFNMSESFDAVVELLAEIVHPKVPIESKPMLTLGEAQKYLGVSRQYLLQAIKSNRLKGIMIGKAWRLSRTDLERFSESLF